MAESDNQVHIRSFEPADANACFRIRTEAFICIFFGELGPEAVTEAVNAYMPSDLAEMANSYPTFVSVLNGEIVAFCMLRGQLQPRVEIFLLYVRRSHIRVGLGRELVRFAEEWIAGNYPEIPELYVDTVVPGYNAGFYEKIGFTRAGEHPYTLLGATLRALRLTKSLA